MRRILFLGIIFSLLLGTLFAQQQQVRREPPRGMVGIQLGQKNGKYYVVHVFKNSPAERAGLKGGDTLLRVREQDLSGLSMPEVLNLFNGDPQTEVEVAVMRGREEVPPVRINRIAPKKLYETSPDFQKPPPRRARSARHPKVTPPPPKSETPPLDSQRLKSWLDHLEKVYGFRATLIDEKFSEKLGTLYSEGLLVLEVKEGKLAAKAGLEKWDLIYRVEGRSPLELFRTQPPPPETSGHLPLNITLMGLMGEKPLTL